jgi:hypothetical protein
LLAGWLYVTLQSGLIVDVCRNCDLELFGLAVLFIYKVIAKTITAAKLRYDQPPKGVMNM